MFCPKCNNEIKVSNNTCKFCGYDIEAKDLPNQILKIDALNIIIKNLGQKIFIYLALTLLAAIALTFRHFLVLFGYIQTCSFIACLYFLLKIIIYGIKKLLVPKNLLVNTLQYLPKSLLNFKIKRSIYESLELYIFYSLIGVFIISFPGSILGYYVGTLSVYKENSPEFIKFANFTSNLTFILGFVFAYIYCLFLSTKMFMYKNVMKKKILFVYLYLILFSSSIYLGLLPFLIVSCFDVKPKSSQGNETK